MMDSSAYKAIIFPLAMALAVARSHHTNVPVKRTAMCFLEGHHAVSDTPDGSSRHHRGYMVWPLIHGMLQCSNRTARLVILESIHRYTSLLVGQLEPTDAKLTMTSEELQLTAHLLTLLEYCCTTEFEPSLAAV